MELVFLSYEPSCLLLGVLRVWKLKELFKRQIDISVNCFIQDFMSMYRRVFFLYLPCSLANHASLFHLEYFDDFNIII